MKRSKSINLDRMRKTKLTPLKPLSVVVAASAMVACDSPQQAQIYSDVEHCARENPTLREACEVAYQEAMVKAADSGPKYQTEDSCIAEFGVNNCVPYRATTGQNWFMPAMAGFMFARAIDRNGYHSAPLFTSFSRYSPVYNKWSTVDGNLYGRRRYGAVSVGSDVFKPKPVVTRTISRGGFGSTVSAKSRWSGSSSRSGWGG